MLYLYGCLVIATLHFWGINHILLSFSFPHYWNWYPPTWQCCSKHCNVTVVTTNLACWGWEIWNELETNTSLEFIIEEITKLEQKPTSYSSTQDLQAMWSIQKKVQMHGRANLPKKRSFQPLFTDLRPIQSFTPAPEGSRQPSHSLVFISISYLSYHISKEWDGKLSTFQ